MAKKSQHASYELVVPDPEMMTGDVLRLQADSWRETYPNEQAGISERWVYERTEGWFRPESIARRRQYLQDALQYADTNFWRVAVDNRRPVGMIYGQKDASGQQLHALYVDRRYHGKGAAHQLIDAFIAWADGDKPITLEVAAYNERARAFYRKHHFREVAGSEHLYDEKIPVITMKRPAKEKI